MAYTGDIGPKIHDTFFLGGTLKRWQGVVARAFYFDDNNRIFYDVSDGWNIHDGTTPRRIDARSVTDVNVASYTVLSSDDFLQVRRTITGICAITLPLISTVKDGRHIYIKDSKYNASNFNITIVRSGSDKIENVDGNFIVSGDGDCVHLQANKIENNWEVV